MSNPKENPTEGLLVCRFCSQFVSRWIRGAVEAVEDKDPNYIKMRMKGALRHAQHDNALHRQEQITTGVLVVQPDKLREIEKRLMARALKNQSRKIAPQS